MNSHKISSLALVTASLLLAGQVEHAADQKVSISSVGHMSNDTGFALNIPQILKNSSALSKAGFFSTTSSSRFNATGTVDCAFVIDNTDGSHDIILSGSTTETAEFGSLVPPELSKFNLVNNQYYGRVKVGANGVLSRSNFPSEFEGCAFSGDTGEPKTDVLPAGFPTGDPEFCNAQNFKNVQWITCKQLKGKGINNLEDRYGLSIDRKMDAGITVFP